MTKKRKVVKKGKIKKNNNQGHYVAILINSKGEKTKQLLLTKGTHVVEINESVNEQIQGTDWKVEKFTCFAHNELRLKWLFKEDGYEDLKSLIERIFKEAFENNYWSKIEIINELKNV